MTEAQSMLATQEDFLALKEDVRAVKEDVRAVKEDVRAVKEDVRAVKEDVNRLRKDTEAGFLASQRETDRLRGDVKALEAKVTTKIAELTVSMHKQIWAAMLAAILILGFLMKVFSN